MKEPKTLNEMLENMVEWAKREAKKPHKLPQTAPVFVSKETHEKILQEMNKEGDSETLKKVLNPLYVPPSR